MSFYESFNEAIKSRALPIPEHIKENERREILERLFILRDAALPTISEETRHEVKIKISLGQPTDSVTRPDLFNRFSKTFCIPGKSDLGAAQYFGGLTTPGYSWLDFAAKNYDRTGIHTEVYPLKGQNGNWFDF